MEITSLLYHLLLGGLLGALGQGIRVIVGLKKTYDTSLQTSKKFGEVFEGRQLFLSLLIGFIAGCLGIVVMLDFDSGTKPPLVLSKAVISELVAIGYAGADFIEGFVKKYLPSNGTSTPDVYSNSGPVTPPLSSTPSPGKINQP